MTRDGRPAAALAIAAVAVVIGYNYFTAPERPEPSVVAMTNQPPKKDRYGNCRLMGLGGQVLNFSGQVKRDLRNPASFEHVETRAGPIKDGIFPVAMTYRGTNGFGAVDTKVATGEVRVADCFARVLTME